MKFIFLEGIHDIAKNTLKSQGLKVSTIKSALADKELTKKTDITGLGIRSRTKITKKILQSLSPSLRVIGAFCIGTDQIDLKSARQMGIPVFNAPYGNTRSVAEMVIGHIISLSRQIYLFNQMMHQKKWHKNSKGSREVRGKTLGIVGYGHIGTQVGVLAESMGMKVMYFDIIDTLPIGNVESMRSLKELLSRSDFVTLHVPDTPLTRNMIQMTELKWMRKGSYLINTSRGTVVKIRALKKALQEGHLAGAALDVFPEEPQAQKSSFLTELQGMEQVILTPHVGGSTKEAQENIAIQVSRSLTKFLYHGVSEGAVNFPILTPPPLEQSHIYRRLVNVHKNVPGVLAKINGLVSRSKINIKTQLLATDFQIGYLIMDVETAHTSELRQAIDSLSTSITTHILPIPSK